ncbi:SAM-dependent methyltransferase [Saccharomonospora iraqiensis]|uniref:SAM-dependent methyltransferase n=1 Tax=Saccharomonospora iraqiensis TaxID=52698 RepID=UPI00022E1CE7|nr:SAM-dependent methyltransferase [Saccharomonospora iraqiensis]
MGLPIGATDPDPSVAPNIARIRDYWVEGTNHTEQDRRLAQRIELCAPHIPYLVRAQRSLVRRMVRHLMRAGVTQFLDLGSGLPNAHYVHHVAHAEDPRARVVYVDADTSIEADSRALLDGTDNTAFVVADVRRPAELLAHPGVTALIDPDRPVAILMIELLLHIPDADDPAGLVRSYVDALPSGGHLALSHFGEDDQVLAGFRIFEGLRFGQWPAVSLRSRDTLESFFDGLDLVEPGVVPVPLWRPDSEDEVDRNPERVRMYAGLGRKP